MTTFAEEPTRTLTADGLLVRAHLEGDENAFAELYRRYYQDVVRIVRARVRDHALAEDLAQDAFSRALRYLSTFDPTQPFWPWIRRIAVTVASSEMVRRAKEVPVGDVSRDAVVLPDATDTIALQAAVMESLRLLPKRQRHALVMRYIEDRDAKDIATLLGLSRNAVEQLLLRARTNFARDYRARNVAVVPVVGPLVARLRRILAALGARLQSATGTGLSVAGDVALGAALTVGGIGVVTFGGGFGESLPAPQRESARHPDGQQPFVPPNSLAQPPPHGTVAHGPSGPIGAVGGGPTTGHVARAGTYRPTANPTPGHHPPGVSADDPASPSPGSDPEPDDDLPRVAVNPPPANPPVTPSEQPSNESKVVVPTATAPPAPAATTAAPSGNDAPHAQSPTSEPPGDDPVPEPTVWFDDEGAGAAVEEDTSNASGQMTAKKDPTQEGDVANGEGNADVGGRQVGGDVTVSNSSDDGALCHLLKVLCT